MVGVDGSLGSLGVSTTSAEKRPTLDQSFDWRSNSLNLLRLVLASAVIFAHASTLSLVGSENVWGLGKTTFGALAVYGFFGISGFLIARSAVQNGALDYLWKRFLRIFPAFWVCLLVTAFGFGLIGWLHSNPHEGCGVSCYLNEPNGPVGYVYRNFFLYVRQPQISSSLKGSALPNLWNASIWTLWWEFLCYVMLALAAVTGLLRRRWPVACATVILWGTLAVVVAVPRWNAQFSAFHFATWKDVLELFSVFLLGSCIYLYRDKIPDSGILAALSTAAFLVSFVLPIGSGTPAWFLTSVDVAAIFLVYPLIWLGMHLPLPFKRVGSKNDYSYGIYIYGFPVQQLLAIFGVVSWGYFAFSVLGLLGAIPLAVLSWWLVEKRALRLKTVHPSLRRARRSTGAPDGNAVVPAPVEEG